MKRPQLVNDEIYHVYNRGVEKRDVFLEKRDYLRFTQDLYEFNDTSPALNLGFHLQNNTKPVLNRVKSKENLVDILWFVLIPNHYHLVLRQKVDNGVTEFMRKLGTGYTNYFNTKRQRVGPLFQGKFKAVHVTKEAHFLYLPHYIHLNPLDLFMPEWREKKIGDVELALQYLGNYHWSSYPDYIGNKNFSHLLSPISQDYRSRTSIVDYKKEIKEWLESLDLEVIRDVILD